MSPTSTPDSDTIFQLRVSLAQLDPPIWRRILVPSQITLYELHEILQLLFSWDNYHQHRFQIGEQRYSDPLFRMASGTRNEKMTQLGQVVPPPGHSFRYEYDFGNSWELEIEVEARWPAEPGGRYPRCTGGELASPPEDSGGIWGFVNLLQALENPEDPEHVEIRAWVGDDYDPSRFDLEATNARLRALSR